MRPTLIGLIWAFSFVWLESAQFVYFGGLFQHVNSFLFGFCVLGLTSVAFIAAAWVRTPGQVRTAFATPLFLLKVNAATTLSWIAFLGSVQLIEPAIAYTIGAGVMPLTAVLLNRLKWDEGEPMRNRVELVGNGVVAISIVFLAVITLLGLSGFVRNGIGTAVLGVALAVVDGMLSTVLLAYCQRMDRSGVGPAAVFGLRFPLYVLTAGSFALVTVDPSEGPDLSTLSVAIGAGLALIVPPLYALQRAVAVLSTMTLSAITATGPLVIFAFQIAEGRVDQSGVTLFGLVVYFVGATVAASSAVFASIKT